MSVSTSSTSTCYVAICITRITYSLGPGEKTDLERPRRVGVSDREREIGHVTEHHTAVSDLLGEIHGRSARLAQVEDNTSAEDGMKDALETARSMSAESHFQKWKTERDNSQRHHEDRANLEAESSESV